MPKIDKIQALVYTYAMNTIYFERETSMAIEKAFASWRVVLLFGARQIGKTTMAENYFESLMCKKKRFFGQNKETQTLFASLSLTTISSLIGDATFIFIDEAQYIEEIGTVLKLIYDAMPHVQVLATGSSAFGLASKTHEAMTGRALILSVFPLSYREIASNSIFKEIAPNTTSMLIHGTYPKVLAASSRGDKEEILRLLSDAYLYKDVLEFHGIRKAPMIAKLAQMLALQVGNQVSLSELSRSLEIHKNTVQSYIDVLIKSFIIFPVSSLSRNKRKELHTSIKYYFYDNGIRNAIIRNFADLTLRDDVGALWENYIASELYKRETYDKKSFTVYHWRTYDQKEIDILIEENGILSAYECKYNGDTHDMNRATMKAWNELYPTVPVEVINKNNYREMLQ